MSCLANPLVAQEGGANHLVVLEAGAELGDALAQTFSAQQVQFHALELHPVQVGRDGGEEGVPELSCPLPRLMPRVEKRRPVKA